MSAHAGASCVSPADLHVEVAPETLDRDLSRRIVEQVFSELTANPCRGAAALDAKVDVAVEWPEGSPAQLTVKVRARDDQRTGTRALDLDDIADDGRPLAIAIAADELTRELREELAIPPSPPPEEHHVVIVMPPAPKPVPPPPREKIAAFGPAASVEYIASGITLVGPDARFAVELAPHLLASARLGLRAGIAADHVADVASALVAGGKLVAAPTTRGPFVLGASLGVDALVLRLRDVPPDGAARTHALFVPSGGLASTVHLSSDLQLAVDTSVGAVVSPYRRTGETGTNTDVSGVVVSASVAIVARF